MHDVDRRLLRVPILCKRTLNPIAIGDIKLPFESFEDSDAIRGHDCLLRLSRAKKLQSKLTPNVQCTLVNIARELSGLLNFMGLVLIGNRGKYELE